MKKIFFVLGIVFLCLTGASAQAETAMSRPDGFEDLAEKMVSTVVNISTTTKIEANNNGNAPAFPMFPPGSPFEEFFKHFYDQRPENSSPTERNISALGSGFVIDAEKGYVVTNNHVVKGADEIKVILDDNTNIAAELVGTDEKTDIALLKVKTDRKLAAAPWGDSDKARVGSWILAIGNPFGLGGTVTAGIVSARHRDINAGPYDEYIQTDASINRGNSGGPMFNMAGEVVGINTAIYSPTGGSVGIGFAIPSNMAKGVIEQLIKYGKTKRGWLGVRIQEVTPEIAESLDLETSVGAMVASVNPKGPAEDAGIKTGDIILKFNGFAVDKMRSLPKLVAETEVGKKVEVVLWRKGSKKTVSVVLGQLEKAEETGLLKGSDSKEKTSSDSLELKDIGLSVASLNDQYREQYKISENIKGVLVSAITRGGMAEKKGLMVGDVIVEADQQEVIAPKEIEKIIKEAKKKKKSSVLLFVARGDDMRFVALKFDK